MTDRLNLLNRILAGSHSSKLQHRAPSEIRLNLSHVRKTLESGIPVPPSATSLDVVGQWLLCCAGDSPTEGPGTAERREKTRVSFIKLFFIHKVVKAKASGAAKYPVIHKEAVRKSLRNIDLTGTYAGFFHWTFQQAAGILIARWGHL